MTFCREEFDRSRHALAEVYASPNGSSLVVFSLHQVRNFTVFYTRWWHGLLGRHTLPFICRKHHLHRIMVKRIRGGPQDLSLFKGGGGGWVRAVTFIIAKKERSLISFVRYHHGGFFCWYSPRRRGASSWRTSPEEKEEEGIRDENGL